MSDLLLENERISLILAKRDEENRNLKEVINELMTESNSKDQAISKASKVIDLLREDLEKSFNDLKNSEVAKTKLLRENRELEKELLELKKSSQQLVVVKNAEKRAKNEKMKLKEELNQTAREFGTKESEFMRKYNELQDENKKLFGKIENFQVKAKDFQEKISNLEKELGVSEELVKSLEFRLEEAGINLDKLESEKKALIQNSQSEIALIKREAENKIRVLQNGKENTISQAKGKTIRNASLSSREDDIPINNNDKTLKKKRGISDAELQPDSLEPQSFPNFSIDFFREILSESIEKNRVFLEKLDQILSMEAKSLNLRLKNEVSSYEMALRPEVEAWMMRCEELATRLSDSQRKMANLTVILRDFIKLTGFSKKNALEEKKMSEILAKELESNVNFLQVEVQEKNRKVETIISENLQVFQQVLETTQGKIQDLLQNIAFLQQSNRVLKQDRDFLYQTLNETKRENNTFVGQILTLQKRLEIHSESLEISSEHSEKSIDSYLKIDEIYLKFNELSDKIAALERENYDLKTEKNNEKFIFESEKLQITEQLSFLQENLNGMNKRLEECNEIIANLELKNAELKENEVSNEKMDALVRKLERKKQKIEELKRNAGVKKMGNSMSFEENPCKNVLNTTGENSSELMEEFSSEKNAEVLRQRLSKKFEQKFHDFELVLRFFEKSLDFLIDSNTLFEEKDRVFQELLNRNENVKNWVLKTRGALQMILNKNLRNFTAERDFLLKLIPFLKDNCDIRDPDFDPLCESLKSNNPGNEKFHCLHLLRTKIIENMESIRKKSFRTPRKEQKLEAGNETLVFLKEIYSELKGFYKKETKAI